MADSRQSKPSGGAQSRMKTREWSSLPGDKTMLQTEWTMAPGETPITPAAQPRVDASNYDIQVYEEDNKLSDKDYFARLNSDSLLIQREMKEWQQKYIGNSINLDEEVDKLLKSGLDWRSIAEDLKVDDASQLEVEEEMARIAPLTLPELLEIVCDTVS